VVTAQQIRVNNLIPADGGHQKQEPPKSEFTVHRILRLCDMFATQHPKSRVIVIIQRPTYPLEVEETTPEAGLNENNELDLLLSSLGQGDMNENSLDYGPDSEPEALEKDSLSFSYIESVQEDEYKEREEQLLTNRETEILKYIACGETNKRIAYIVGISEQTVKCHVSSILRKLRANDRAHSVALALRNGFI
jgi:two-component system response regulator DegU